MIDTIAWTALIVGDGVQAPDGTWHRVTRAEAGWIELDGATAFRAPDGYVTAWDSAMAGAVGVVAAHLGGVEVEHAE